MAESPLPPGNYLWTSPYGTSCAGYHHQLIFHLLARDQDWLQQKVDLNKIKAHLGMRFPQFMMDDASLEAIGVEYLGLSRVLRTAYRLVNPEIRVSRPQYNDHISYKPEVEQPVLENFLDPALFEQSEPSSPTRPILSSSPPLFSDSTAATIFSEAEMEEVAERVRAVKGTNHGSATRQHPGANHRSRGSFRVTKTKPNPAIFRPKTPTKLIRSSTPSRPTPDRFIDLYGSPPSPTSSGSDNRSNDIPTHTGSITKDVSKILFYAQNVHKARQENRPITDMPPKQPPFQVVDGNTIDTSEMRLPDPTKYIQTSKNHYTIPASEAEAFCYWFEPSVDAVPDKIDGYRWYCDACYKPENEGSAGVRGRFRQKRSVQRHYDLVHHAVWKPVLPEPDRAAKAGSRGNERAVVEADDEDEEEAEEDQGGKIGEDDGQDVTGDSSGEIAGMEGTEQDVMDVEVSGALEALKEPEPQLAIVFQSIDEVVMSEEK